MMNEQEIRIDLISKLNGFLSAPTRIETAAQGKAYLTELAATFMRMRPNAEEWDHVWSAFLREWDKPYWPLPSEFPKRLTVFRAKQSSVRKAAGMQQHEPESRQQVEHRPYRHGEFMAALDTARRNAAENHPQWGALDRGILRMGEALLRNRDDQDRERYPEAAE